MENNKVAFIGLGRMGSGMAACLLDACFQVCVHNRSADKAAALLQRGAAWADTPREAAQGACAVIAMLADDTASRACWLGENGALAGLADQALVTECSTLSHQWVLKLSEFASQRELRYIDCPVTGLPQAAAQGKLTLLVGASECDLEVATPYLHAFSDDVVHFGKVGTGTAYKLMINLMGAVQIAAAAEGLALAERAGLDLGKVVDTLQTGQAASPQVVRNARIMAADSHAAELAFTPRLRLKDADYALELAADLNLLVPLGDTARMAFSTMCELGMGDENESRVIDVTRQQNKNT